GRKAVGWLGHTLAPTTLLAWPLLAAGWPGWADVSLPGRSWSLHRCSRCRQSVQWRPGRLPLSLHRFISFHCIAFVAFHFISLQGGRGGLPSCNVATKPLFLPGPGGSEQGPVCVSPAQCNPSGVPAATGIRQSYTTDVPRGTSGDLGSSEQMGDFPLVP